jgi:NitT/TauT family transport system substrate-binding protein
MISGQTGNLPVRHLFVIGIILIILVAILGACSKDDREGPTGSVEKMTLGVSAPDYPVFFAFILLAKEQGYFKEQGLDMTYKFYPHGVGSLIALQKGEVELATAAEFPFVRQSLEGSHMRIIASIAQVDVLQLFARKDSGISQPADLKGKRVALIMGSQLEFCLDRFLVEKSILDHTADAVVYREPMLSRLKAKFGDNWISWSVQNKQNVFWIIAGKDKYVSRHSQAIERFLRAIRKAEMFYLSDARKALDIIISKGNLDQELYERMQPTIEYKLTLEQALLIAMEDEARWHIENQYTETKEVPNYLDQIYFDALESVNPDAVGITH